eukprot:scaffold11264_cov120-Isochrysis_galbana.AAC.1
MYHDLDWLGECLEGVRRRPSPESREAMAALATVLFTDERMLLNSIEQVRNAGAAIRNRHASALGRDCIPF